MNFSLQCKPRTTNTADHHHSEWNQQKTIDQGRLSVVFHASLTPLYRFLPQSCCYHIATVVCLWCLWIVANRLQMHNLDFVNLLKDLFQGCKVLSRPATKNGSNIVEARQAASSWQLFSSTVFRAALTVMGWCVCVCVFRNQLKVL